MFNEIWKNIKNTFCFIYDKILYKLIKPMYFVLAVFCLYCFMNCLIHYEILLAFANLYAAIIFLKLFEEGEL